MSHHAGTNNSRGSGFGGPVQHLLYQFGLVAQTLAQGALVQQQSVQQEVAPTADRLLDVLGHVELWHLEDGQDVSPAGGRGRSSCRGGLPLLFGVCQHGTASIEWTVIPGRWLSGSCHKYHFCRDKYLSQQTQVCHDKLLSWHAHFCHDKHVFVVTTHIFCCNKSMLVVTKILLQQNYVCRDKYLLRQ